MREDSFDFALGRALLEMEDPGLAHWALGLASEAGRRALGLIESGGLRSFASCQVGVSKRRVPSREDARFRDGSGLVELKQNDPWEAAALAKSGLGEGEAWVCLRLVPRASDGESNSVWACVGVSEADRGGFGAFWARCEMELARAEVQAGAHLLLFGGGNGERGAYLDGLREGARAVMERAELAAESESPAARGTAGQPGRL